MIRDPPGRLVGGDSPRDGPPRRGWPFIRSSWSVACFFPSRRGGYRLPTIQQGDTDVYIYHLIRAGEVGGRWWKVADDSRLGGHYPPEVAKMPGIYEGVDLMLLCALPSRYLDGRQLYHLAVLIILATNGWAAGWMVRRLTGSYSLAAMAVTLLTLSLPPISRVTCGHIHLAKYGWVILAAWAFANYLGRPRRTHAVLLGLATAGVLQGSFYLGYLLGIGMFTWWFGCFLARRVGRRHLVATCLAGLTLALVGGVSTFPVWTTARTSFFADDFFQRNLADTCRFGSALWQFFVPHEYPWAYQYVNDVRVKTPEWYSESYHFPGYTVLSAMALYLVARLRGWRFRPEYAPLLDVLMGLIAVSILLSLAGGPSFFLYHLFPSIRCYGRACLIALALGCVATPLILHCALGMTRSRWLRASMVAVALGLLVHDGSRTRDCIGSAIYGESHTKVPTPAWVDWLAEQPEDVHLAAFTPFGGDPFYNWGIFGLDARSKHHHVTLNGADFRLLEGDLRLLGASYNRMNPRALRFVASLGFNTLAFDIHYLWRNPWIAQLPWLHWSEPRGDWRFAMVGSELDKFPRMTLEQLLARQPKRGAATDVPASSWITGELDVDQEAIVSGRVRALVAWADEQGTPIEKPSNVLFQHVYGPNLPAFTVRTPAKPGRYQHLFMDCGRRPLASKPYRVVDNLFTIRQALLASGAPIKVKEVSLTVGPGERTPRRIVLENTSPFYIQAHVERETVAPSARNQPGIGVPEPGSLVLRLQEDQVPGSPPAQEWDLLLPRDIPPHGRIAMDLSYPISPYRSSPTRVCVRPCLIQVGESRSSPEIADLQLVVEPLGDPPSILRASRATDGTIRE